MKSPFCFCISILTACLLMGLASPSGTHDLLTQGPWTSGEDWQDWDGDGVFTLDMHDCQKDNRWVFSQDGHFIVSEGPIVCDTGIKIDSIPGTWVLKNNETELEMMVDSTDEKKEFKIFSISGARAELFLVDPDSPSAPVQEKIILFR